MRSTSRTILAITLLLVAVSCPVMASGSPAAVERYIKGHGPKAFLAQIYKLAGNSETTVLDKDNMNLAAWLGLDAANSGPVAKEPNTSALAPEARERAFARLREYLANSADLGFSREQKLFMGWQFAAGNGMYGLNYTAPSGDIAVGWENHAELPGNGDAFMATFGLCGCTAMVAVAPSGDVQLSHFASISNPLQVDLAVDFVKRFPDAKLYLVGSVAASLAATLRMKRIFAPIFVHIKFPFYETAYAVAVARRQGQVRIEHDELPLDMMKMRHSVWIDTIQKGLYQLGDASLIYPDTPFVTTEFITWW